MVRKIFCTRVTSVSIKDMEHKNPINAEENKKRCASTADMLENPVKKYIKESDDGIVSLLSNNQIPVTKNFTDLWSRHNYFLHYA